MSNTSKQTKATPVELSTKDLETVQGGFPYYYNYGQKKQAVLPPEGEQSAKGDGSGTKVADLNVWSASSQARSSTVG